MAHPPFTLDLHPERLRSAARRLQRVGTAVDEQGTYVQATPALVTAGWTGRGARRTRRAIRQLGAELARATDPVEDARHALRRLARQYEEALEQLPGLNLRWHRAVADHAADVVAVGAAHSADTRDLDDAEALESAERDLTRSLERLTSDLEGAQAAVRADFEALREVVRAQTRAAGQVLNKRALATRDPAEFADEGTDVLNRLKAAWSQGRWLTNAWDFLRTAVSAPPGPPPPSDWPEHFDLYPDITVPDGFTYDPTRGQEMLAALEDRLDSFDDLDTQARAAAVRAWTSTLDPTDLLTLTLVAPRQVGNLAGYPEAHRYGANRLTLVGTRDEYAAEIATIEGRATELLNAKAKITLVEQREISRLHRRRELLTAQLAAVDLLVRSEGTAHVVGATKVTDPPQVLVCHPPRFTADGTDIAREARVAVVFGDLTRAQYVNTVVGGMTTDFTTFETQMKRAGALRGEGGDTASIAWMEHEPPPFGFDVDTLDAMSRDRAEAGADELVRFGDELVLTPGASKQFFGHSYGGLTVARALKKDLDADTVVFLGTPGPGSDIDDVSQIRGDEVTLYAASAPKDWVPGKGHGPDLVALEGVTPLKTYFGGGGISIRGHTSYYKEDSDSLLNLLAIANGRTPYVQEPPAPVEVPWGRPTPTMPSPGPSPTPHPEPVPAP